MVAGFSVPLLIALATYSFGKAVQNLLTTEPTLSDLDRQIGSIDAVIAGAAQHRKANTCRPWKSSAVGRAGLAR